MRGFVELRWRSNGGWTEAIGCATEAAICTCGPAQNRCGRPQVLPAYGLQDLRNKHQDPKTKSNPNTMHLQTTLGEDHGSGHFYLAKTRTFLLCVDTNGLAGVRVANAPVHESAQERDHPSRLRPAGSFLSRSGVRLRE